MTDSASAASATVRVRGPTCASVPSGEAGKGRHARARRLDAEAAGERRRDADRAAAVGAEVQCAHPQHRGGHGPGRGAAGGHARVPGVAGGARERAVAGGLPAVLGHRRLAEEDGARLAQPWPPPARRCSAGSAAVSREPKRAGMPATRMLSLMPSGHAVDEPRGLPACQRASEARAAASAPSGSRWHQALTAAIVPLDAGQGGLRGLHGRERLAAVKSDELGGRQGAGSLGGLAVIGAAVLLVEIGRRVGPRRCGTSGGTGSDPQSLPDAGRGPDPGCAQS